MSGTVDDTLVHVIRLTRHIKTDDVPRALLAVLMELRFQPQNDGFWYLRMAIYEKYKNPDQRLKAIYLIIGELSDACPNTDQVEQAIHSAIDAAWRARDEEKWALFFPCDRKGRVRRPTNGEFIARIACFMELWQGCSREVCYATK